MAGNIKGNYEYINTDQTVKLFALLLSGDIHSKSIIEIYDADGKFLAKALWDHNSLEHWYLSRGQATKVGTSNIVKFKLV